MSTELLIAIVVGSLLLGWMLRGYAWHWLIDHSQSFRDLVRAHLNNVDFPNINNPFPPDDETKD